MFNDFGHHPPLLLLLPSLAPAHTPRSPSYRILAFISWLLHLALSLPAGAALPSAFPPLPRAPECLTLPQPSPRPNSHVLEGCSGGCPHGREGEPPSPASPLVSVISGTNLGGMESGGSWLDAQRDALTHALTPMAVPLWWGGVWVHPGVLLPCPELVAAWMSWGPSSEGPLWWGVRGELGMEQSPCCRPWWLWLCSWPRCHMASGEGAGGAGGSSLGCAKLL